MNPKVDLDAAYQPSADIVARVIEGELIVIPLVAGIGDMEDELFTANETGRAIWDRLDGRRTLRDIVTDLSASFDAPSSEIEQDVVGFMQEVVRRGIVVESAPA